MDIIKTEKGSATVVISLNEMVFINNALNEVFECLDENELSIRIGGGRDELRALQIDAGKIIQLLKLKFD